MIIIPTGEPAGIGPDICLSLKPKQLDGIVFLGDKSMLKQRAEGLDIDIQPISEDELLSAATSIASGESFNLIHYPLAEESTPGTPNKSNNSYVLDILRAGARICARLKAQGQYPILINAPVGKSQLNLSIPFVDATSFLAEAFAEESRQGTAKINPFRAFCGETNIGELRVAFATMHIPLAEVATRINAEIVEHSIRGADYLLKSYFNISAPRLAICGINPHAGEGGLLGKEEQEWLSPLIDKLKNQGLNAKGPLSADSLFTPTQRNQYDCIVATAHDQGLAPFKALTFGRGAQLSLLGDGEQQILRLSPDHGTAFGLAATGLADGGSMAYSVNLAQRLQSTFNKRTA